jgi:hypothetical protein
MITLDGSHVSDSVPKGALVAYYGMLEGSGPIGAEFLNPGSYLFINQVVEVFGWHEKSHSYSVGPSSETTYTYEKTWLWGPCAPPSNSFQRPRGHENPYPCRKVPGEEYIVPERIMAGPYWVSLPRTEVRIAPYTYSDVRMGENNPFGIPFDEMERIKLSPSNAIEKDGFAIASDDYLFRGEGTLNNPSVGDQRISYRVIRSGARGTIFGAYEGESIGVYRWPNSFNEHANEFDDWVEFRGIVLGDIRRVLEAAARPPMIALAAGFLFAIGLALWIRPACAMAGRRDFDTPYNRKTQLKWLVTYLVALALTPFFFGPMFYIIWFVNPFIGAAAGVVMPVMVLPFLMLWRPRVQDAVSGKS